MQERFLNFLCVEEKCNILDIQEAIELYLEDVLESGDEKEFIPRSAPVEEWLKYFEVEAKNLKKKILDKSNTAGLRLHEAVYA